MVKIIAIGTSAGGLKPLEDFFEACGAVQDVCFVILQHLSPGYRSLMDELLARKSPIPIRKLTDGDTIAPNTIFLNSPSSYVEIEGDVFRVKPYDAQEAFPRLPINHFFSSLATSLHRPAAAVVMSGTGSDGAQGSLDLSRAGVRIFVESPDEAEFSAMPRAVLSQCPNAVVAAARKLPQIILEKLEIGEIVDTPTNTIKSPYKRIINLLERQHGLDFQYYKDKTILRRIARRCELRGFQTEEQYLTLLEQDPDAVSELYSDILIGVTSFYRDPECFLMLKELVYPSLIERAKQREDLRIWVPACGTGEEAYSIAIDLSEAMISAGVNPDFRIIATDVFNPAIRLASLGRYSESQVQNVPTRIRERYFVQHGGSFSVHNSIRQRIIFSTHNAINDAPFMNLDFVSCRNMMIYLDHNGQEQLMTRLIFGMKQNGFLLLGPSETLGKYASDFNELSAKWRIFNKVTERRVTSRTFFQTKAIQTIDNEVVKGMNAALADSAQARKISARPPAIAIEGPAARQSDAAELRTRLVAGYDALLKRYAPSSILIDMDGTVLTWFGSAGLYIDTKSNLAEWRVEEIVHPDLQYFINIGIERVRKKELSTLARRIKIEMDDGNMHIVDAAMEPLGRTTATSRCILVILRRNESPPESHHIEVQPTTESEDLAEKELLSSRIKELEKDLRLTEESLQYVTERLEANAEELQASNEELQASNEELQASNEELQASNEELQAVNEELISVSTEHERKIEMINDVDHETEIVMTSCGMATLVLDENLCILRFSSGMGDLLGLRTHDHGRPIRSVGEKVDFANFDEMSKFSKSKGQIAVAKGIFHEQELTLRIRYIPNSNDFASARYIVIMSGLEIG